MSTKMHSRKHQKASIAEQKRTYPIGSRLIEIEQASQGADLDLPTHEEVIALVRIAIAAKQLIELDHYGYHAYRGLKHRLQDAIEEFPRIYEFPRTRGDDE